MIDETPNNSGRVLDALAGQPEREASIEQINSMRAIQELAERELCKRKLLPFVCRANPSYLPGWVHEIICQKLEEFELKIREAMAANATGPRLLITLPPRHGKSEIASRCFPAWYLGKNPQHEIIATSYSANLALKFSRTARALYTSPMFQSIFPGAELDRDSRAAENWLTRENGGYLAAGVGGSITGSGMHCVDLQTRIITNKGPKKLEYLFNNSEEDIKVLSYHSGGFEWRKINAVFRRTTKEYYEIRTEKGVLKITGEHPICVGFDRTNRPIYRRVDELRSGDRVINFELTDGEKYKNMGAMPDVRHNIYEAEKKVPKWGSRASLLLQQMFGSVTLYRQKCFGELSRVRKRSCGLAFKKIESAARAILLFLGVYRETSFENICKREASSVHINTDGMHTVQEEILPQKVECWRKSDKESFLLPKVLRGMVDWSPYPEGHRPNHGTILPSRVQTNTTDVPLHGTVVCRLRGRCRRIASQGSKHRKQFSRKFSACLQKLSYTTPHEKRKPKTLTVRKVNKELEVGDISVDGVDNFIIDANYLLLNCGIIDDPLKNRDEAQSETIRESIIDWYTSTFYTRLAPGGGIIVIQTRWHEADLAGWLLDEMKRETGDVFEHLNFPAIAEQDEAHRSAGEALHEERYPINVLQQIKSVVGDRDFASLYQQRPAAAEGDQFKRSMLHYYEDTELPPKDQMTFYQAWDFAIGQKQLNDYTVGICVGIDQQDNVWVVDLVRGKWDSLRIVDEMLDFWELWQAERVGLEHGQIAMALDALIEKRIAERNMWAFPYNKAENLKPGRQDKVARSATIRGRMRQRKVFLPKDAPWISAFTEELLVFPNGRHDDQVDALAWIGVMLNLFYAPRDQAPDDDLPKWLKKILNKGRYSQHSGGSASAMGA